MIHTEETEPTKTPMGTVTFVGFGPGDPGLITWAGSREVAGADLLVVDSPTMVEELASVGIEPLGEVVRVEADEVAQLVEAVTDGRSVVRLVEGDFFTEAGHVDVLRRLLESKRIRTHLIPGITTWNAALTYGAVAPTSVMGFCDTSIELPDKDGWPKRGTVVIRATDESISRVVAEARAVYGEAAEVLELTGLGGTSQKTRLTTWGDLGSEPCGGPRFLLFGPGIGDVARARVDWFESKPLFDWSVLVPRTKDEVTELTDHLARFGASTEVVATMSIEPPRTEQAMEKAVRGIVDGRFLWVVFTSQHAVRAIVDRLAEYGLDSRALSGIQLAAVGRGTVEALGRVGLTPDLTPSEGDTARDLALEFPAYDDLIDPMARVLVPTADVSVADLVQGLTNLGWEVEEVTAYRTVRAAPPPAEIRDRIKTGLFDAVVFTSSSAVRNMIGIAGKPHTTSIIAAIGQATASTCEMHGLRVDVVADSPNFESVAVGLARFADERRADRLAQGLPDTKPSQRRRRRRKDSTRRS